MKTLALLFLSLILSAQEVSVQPSAHTAAQANNAETIKCSCKCEKKELRIREIEEAINFYKTSPYHTFTSLR